MPFLRRQKSLSAMMKKVFSTLFARSWGFQESRFLLFAHDVMTTRSKSDSALTLSRMKALCKLQSTR
jgi:hypothetical protein